MHASQDPQAEGCGEGRGVLEAKKGLRSQKPSPVVKHGIPLKAQDGLSLFNCF